MGLGMKTEGWERRLSEFVTERGLAPLVWGVNDCCLLVADWALSATGVDPIPSLRGRYKTPRGALGVLRRFGGGDVTAAVETAMASLGALEVEVARAQRGDVMAFEAVPLLFAAAGFDVGLGVCFGALSLAFGEERVEAVPTSKALRAWRL